MQDEAKDGGCEAGLRVLLAYPGLLAPSPELSSCAREVVLQVLRTRQAEVRGALS